MTKHDVSEHERAQSSLSVADLSEQYGAYCRSIAYRILRDDEDVEECLADAYRKVAAALAEKEISDVQFYIAATTRNTAVDMFNKRKTAPHTVMFEELEECFGNDETEATTDSIVIRDTLNAFLAGLSATERWVFVRRYWHMDSIKDIAAVCGKRETAVRMMLCRTRKKLKDRLEKEGIYV